MTVMPLISVVIPVFNVEKYLERCVKSVLSQTYSNLEVILVDDGSTDKSGMLCDFFEKKDQRVKVIHKQNKGLSAARNTGIAYARGEYIGFVDSDDHIAPFMYERLLSMCINDRADMAVCGHFDVYDNIEPAKLATQSKVLRTEKAVQSVFTGNSPIVGACQKLYRKSLFDSVKFPEGKIYEDAFVILDLIVQCSRVSMTSEQMYYYVHRKNSITTSHFKNQDFDELEAWKRNQALVQQYFPHLYEDSKVRIVWSELKIIDKMLVSNLENDYRCTDLLKDIKLNLRFILISNVFSMKRKIAVILLLASTVLYKYCLNFEKNKRFQLVG